jgi:hypothetical protein
VGLITNCLAGTTAGACIGIVPILAGPHGKQLDGYVGAAIDHEVREAFRSTAPSSTNADR